MEHFAIQAIAKAEQELRLAQQNQESLKQKFSELAAVNHFPVINCPYADHDQTRHARVMFAGWLVASLLGVACFAILSSLSLNSDLNPVVFFVVSAVVGTLLLVLFEAAVIAFFHVSPRHPESHQPIKALLAICTVVAVVSFAGFAYLRFTAADSLLVSLVSLIFLLFELSLFGMASAFRANVILFEWSSKITRQHDAACSDVKHLEALLKSYKQQVVGPATALQKSAFEGGHDNEVVDHRPSYINGHARNSTNSAPANESLDGKSAV